MNDRYISDMFRLEQREGKVIILTGATAVGKTKTSIELAQRIGGEIISADSVQVYTGLDVGSDKILPSERGGIPHHLIDILTPHQEFSAGDFYSLARAATADILQRGKVPIVVGGTGFYLRWYVHGRPQTPASTAESMQRVQQRLAEAWDKEAAAAQQSSLPPEQQWEVSRQLVASLGDPSSAERLKEVPGNWYRLNRVLDILLSTGRPLGELNLDVEAPLDYKFCCFFLNRNRIDLYRRIDARVEDMVCGGLLQEAKWLLDEGLLPDEKCAARAIGYRQAMQFLERCQQDPSHITAANLVQMVRDIQTASRKLCHRQLSWFRDERLFKWLEGDRPLNTIVDEILADFHGPINADALCLKGTVGLPSSPVAFKKCKLRGIAQAGLGLTATETLQEA
ncbi:g4129 [Coccomyxa viridis]|uniref:tRNA dimethylallyltransferase n=1 Tax=Coccomyxa viridis TaxID=1274662 RepID=A0ABP1FWH2_9CHLO